MAQPSEFQIERSTTIAAPAADIHPWIVDLHHWQAWSPWEGLDPDLELAAVVLTDRPFGAWAKPLWSEFNDRLISQELQGE